MAKLTAMDIWKEYQDGIEYQNSMSFGRKWAEYQRFINGDQWPAPTDATKNLPRPVFNICRMITTQKSSNVLNENITMQFTADELVDDSTDPKQAELIQSASDGATQFTAYSRTLWEKVEQSQLNEDAIEDASSLGTAVWHYQWNSDISGGTGTIYIGEIDGETLDPSNIFFKNPKCQDLQKQPSIIISNDLPIAEIIELAKINKVSQENIEKISSNEEDKQGKIYEADKVEAKGNSRVTLLTRYFKKNGRVYWTKSTNSVIVQDETDLAQGSERGFKLYPIEIMVWYKRKKCIYGIGEIEGLIPNQKAINFNIGMNLLSIQETAWPKIYAKLGALNQQITNTPGEIITDNLINGSDNIKFMQPPNFSYMPGILTDKILDLTRTATGVTDVATGEKLGASISAAAIIALQNQAKVPIEAIQKRFYRSQKRIGRIWEEFFKVRYNIERSVVIKDDNNQNMPMKFKGSDYEKTNFDLKIDVGPSSQFSEGLSTSIYERLFYDAKSIDLNIFIEMLPDNAIQKQKLKRLIKEKADREQAAMLKQQQEIEQAKASLSPEEQQELAANPQIMQQVMQGMGGGQGGLL